MQGHGLDEYLISPIDFLSASQSQFELDSNNPFLLQHDPFPSNLESLEEPQLHHCPFEYSKEEESTRQKPQEEQLTPGTTSAVKQEIIFSSKHILKYRRSFYGWKNDTVELNTNFKTLLVAYFRELSFLKELSPRETKHVEDYAKRVPSFSSLREFYQHEAGQEQIQRRCLQFLESGQCVRRVLRGRCQLKTKVMMIKFIEKMRSNVRGEGVVRWKDNIRWRERNAG